MLLQLQHSSLRDRLPAFLSNRGYPDRNIGARGRWDAWRYTATCASFGLVRGREVRRLMMAALPYGGAPGYVAICVGRRYLRP